MIHAMSKRLTKTFFANGWIKDNQIDWCIYSIEKAISWCFFSTMILIYIVVSKKTMEVIFFTSVFCLFRRHLGGYHTRHHWTCQILSVGLVVAICSLIGPIAEKLNFGFLLFANGCALIILFLIKPSFPKQMNLTSDEEKFHKRKVKELVVACAGMQCLIALLNKNAYVYTLLGLIAVIISVTNGERSF